MELVFICDAPFGRSRNAANILCRPVVTLAPIDSLIDNADIVNQERTQTIRHFSTIV
jgi:hypothetical protein